VASLSCQISAVPVQENTSPIVFGKPNLQFEKPIFKLGCNLEWIPSFLDPDPNVSLPMFLFLSDGPSLDPKGEATYP
jgi:hypothetical protein